MRPFMFLIQQFAEFYAQSVCQLARELLAWPLHCKGDIHGDIDKEILQ